MIARLLILNLSIFFYAQAQSQTFSQSDVQYCNWQSKTPPGALKGNEGSSNVQKYWFQHVTDVDIENEKYRFIYQIRNLHPSKLLPVEWRQSNNKTQIHFERIIPGGCASNDFETYSAFKEDPAGVIRYGPIKQESKTASLYVLDRNQTRSEGSPLKSRLIADIQDAKGKVRRLFIEVTTEYKEKTFLHTVQNLGSNSEIVRIPALASLREKNPNLMAILQWPMEDDQLVINTEKPRSFSYTMSPTRSFQEAIVPIEIIAMDYQTRESEILASGNITLYLPTSDN